MAIEKELLDQLLAGRDPSEVFGKDGLLDDLKKALSERILNAELDDHLDVGRLEGGPANRRNGSSKKTVLTGTSKMTLTIPRDRAGTFDPKLIARYQRRFPDFDDKIISMYARGMTVREIQGHLEELYGIDVSPDLISAVTDTVLEAVGEWQNRPLCLCRKTASIARCSTPANTLAYAWPASAVAVLIVVPVIAATASRRLSMTCPSLISPVVTSTSKITPQASFTTACCL